MQLSIAATFRYLNFMWTMGNKQTGYFVYNSAVEGPDFNYHQDYNQGPYNHEGKLTNILASNRIEMAQ